MHALAVAVELLAGSVWVGGLVTIAVVARVARHQLAGPTRVEFFRMLGRRYLRVGAGALVVAYVDGAALLAGGRWSETKSALVVCAGLLIVVVAAGVMQARSLSRLRTAVLGGDPSLDDRYVNRRAWRAGLLRGSIAGLTFTIVALAAVVVS